MTTDKQRWDKKRDGVEAMSENYKRLQKTVNRDMVSTDDRRRLPALAISLMLHTAERVGNAASAKQGHFGVTQFSKKHIRIVGDTITLRYVGKSGVDQYKTFTHAPTATALQKEMKKHQNQIFVTDDNVTISARIINDVLSKYHITSKDIRGYQCNRLMLHELIYYKPKKKELDTPPYRKDFFRIALKTVAAKIGHTPNTLKNHYLLPEIEKQFLASGRVKIEL